MDNLLFLGLMVASVVAFNNCGGSTGLNAVNQSIAAASVPAIPECPIDFSAVTQTTDDQGNIIYVDRDGNKCRRTSTDGK